VPEETAGRPKAVTWAIGLGGAPVAVAIIANYLGVGSGGRDLPAEIVSLVMVGGLLWSVGVGSKVGRNLYAGLGIILMLAMIMASAEFPKLGVARGLSLLAWTLAVLGMQGTALALLFRPDSSAWFVARTAERREQREREARQTEAEADEQARMAAFRAAWPREAVPGLSVWTAPVGGPLCDGCHRPLKQVILDSGIPPAGARALYMGAVCTKCRLIQCPACKGPGPDAPCPRCGGPAMPAWDKYL